MLVVGGGYIACEFACILNGLGVETSQYYRGAQILRGFDDEARGHLAELMRDRGIDQHVGVNVARVEQADGGLRVHCSDGREALFDAVVYATRAHGQYRRYGAGRSWRYAWPLRAD